MCCKLSLRCFLLSVYLLRIHILLKFEIEGIVECMESRQMACDLEAARITSLPDDAFYISNFIAEDEEKWLLQKVSCVLDVRSDYIACT